MKINTKCVIKEKIDYLSIATGVRMGRTVTKLWFVRGTMPMANRVLNGSFDRMHYATRTAVNATAATGACILIGTGCLGGVTVLLFNFGFRPGSEYIENRRPSIGACNT